MKAKYQVLTWNSEKQIFDAQPGVRRGPYRLFGLRKALRALRECGYTASRFSRRRDSVFDDVGDASVLVQRVN